MSVPKTLPNGDDDIVAFIDDLDRRIIYLLQSNGRASNAGTSRQVGVSEGTIRRRLKRSTQDGIVKVIALPDPEMLGYETEALAGIQVDPDKIANVAFELSALPEASWVNVTTGTFDKFAWVILPPSNELGNFLKSKVRTVVGVRRTETFISLSARKRGHGSLIP